MVITYLFTVEISKKNSAFLGKNGIPENRRSDYPNSGILQNMVLRFPRNGMLFCHPFSPVSGDTEYW